jgi:predicted CoA-substrate-specific enzyme activase
VLNQKGVRININGVGTTGSGRKFIGKIINADLIIDEITSHARAAYELNPLTDTIIEIGGQDAKFTLMRNGNVTFSQMNTVCAAGTGSFLQEQANKLGCSLTDYSGMAENVSAPLASDRCAVFMERDISQLVYTGYAPGEILATALHSVTENYLKKVATEASIGQNICFQGATARNKALVAAFEQRLQKPIFVSKFCHLTGALGAALMLREQGIKKSQFRGTGLYQHEIALETETCTLCANNCCISLTTVAGEKVAFGFMCGRDYDTHHYISANYGRGFLLLLLNLAIDRR